MSNINNEIQVINNNGELVVSSRQVAENFGKRHADVLRSVEGHIEALYTTNAKVRWFHETTYTDVKGESRKEYLMNRDGFCLLVMSFNNTRDVLEWKIKYIEAFNAMEKKLKELSAPLSIDDTLNADVLYLIASKWKADSDKRKELEVRVAELEVQIKTQVKEQPVISEATKVAIKEAEVESHRLYTVTEIAREYGLPDPKTLNLILRDLGIQQRVGSYWKLAPKYIRCGYAVNVSSYANSPFYKWTLKGKKFIGEELAKVGMA